jgi:hypothetical protein
LCCKRTMRLAPNLGSSKLEELELDEEQLEEELDLELSDELDDDEDDEWLLCDEDEEEELRLPAVGVQMVSRVVEQGISTWWMHMEQLGNLLSSIPLHTPSLQRGSNWVLFEHIQCPAFGPV